MRPFRAWDQDWKKATAAYRKALQEFPDQPKALNSLGLALYQLGEFDEALQMYQRVAELSRMIPRLSRKSRKFQNARNLDMAVDSSIKALKNFLTSAKWTKPLKTGRVLPPATRSPDRTLAARHGS